MPKKPLNLLLTPTYNNTSVFGTNRRREMKIDTNNSNAVICNSLKINTPQRYSRPKIEFINHLDVSNRPKSNKRALSRYQNSANKRVRPMIGSLLYEFLSRMHFLAEFMLKF